MAKDAETSKPKHLDPTSEYYLSSQANSGNSLTKDTLKGDNYVAWEQSAILTLKSHNKLAFIDGRITKPNPKSEDFLAWDIVNSTLWASVMTYYTKLLGMWDELLTLSSLESCWCPKDYKHGPVSQHRQSLAMVMQEESHRGITSSRDTTLAVGFHAQNGPPTARSSGLAYVTATQNNNPSIDQAQAAATSALPGLTPEQMQRLITFLESSPSGTDSLVGKSLPTTHTWLIESGASHHMTGNLTFFSSIWDIPPSPVGLLDDLQTNAIKAGSVSLADDITLRHVLYVPNLVVNLISVSCLATVANCFVAFSYDICVLQDRTSKSPIGLGKMHWGMCVLSSPPPYVLMAFFSPMRAVFAKLSTALRSYGFLQSHADHTLFTYRKMDVFLFVLLPHASQVFLGLKATHGPRGLFLAQRKYALDILSESSLSASKSVAFPMEQNHGLALANGPLLSDPGPYRRLIGCLVYLTITRPDICYAVHVLSQFMQSPRSQHWDAALRVLQYLKAAPGEGLFLPADSPLQIYTFCDSD
ncbi:hypothetical protein RJ640_014094 [Escallonia rubra]|uniref:Uncharacterized protein n=1 Tax=Escallonia rubra TaxID=112253 RepID=A0AA88TYX6_9ASTE|nr:hypothetical protein RJ640_014094 [Escallonia rubra]